MHFLLVCLVGLLVSVHASPVSPPVVSGQVRMADGSPVAGAQVGLFDVADLGRGPVGQATTDEAGQFALPLTARAVLMLPQGFALGPNYPNPFNPSTIIPYQLAATSQVRLEVFNVLGQRMATLVDGEQAAGSYRVRWDGTDAAGGAAASGVYFYRLTVDGLQQTGKMVLTDGQAGVPLGGPRVAVEPLAGGSTGSYGLVVSGAGLVAYVDSDFGVEAGAGPVDLVVETQPQERRKVVVTTLDGILGDVNNSGHVDMDDGLLVAMHRVDPSLGLPNHGSIGLGDVDCNGRVELADAALLATYVVHPTAAAVSSRRIGQRGGYSLNPVTETVWGSILGTEKKDAMVARLLDEVPVLISGVFEIDGRDHLYLGIDRAYYQQYGGEPIYNALKQRFPITPLFVEASDGVQREPEPVPPRAKRATDEPEEEPEEEMEGEPEEEPEEEPDDDSGGLFSLFDVFDDVMEGPDLTVSRTTASPASVQPGDPVTLRARITNIGTVDAPSANAHVYRHTATTTDPRRLGTREPNATGTGTLLVPNVSVSVTVETTAPAVSTTYYYYVCVDLVEGEQQSHNNCSGTPATVMVQSDSAPTDEGISATPEDETPAPTETPNLTISSLSISPNSVESEGSVTIQVTVRNSGTADAGSETIRIYRHRTRTANPKSGGTRLSNTASTGTLTPGAQVTKTITASTPTVTASTTFYYYACVDSADGETEPDDNCTGPAAVEVLKPLIYREVMGGDGMFTQRSDERARGDGTITLGGVETTDGTRGFIVSAHVAGTNVDMRDLVTNLQNIDIFIGNSRSPEGKIDYYLGKLARLSRFRVEWDYDVVRGDAAFIAYPHPKTPGCSVTWDEDDETFCLDIGHSDEYVERVKPLVVRGEDGDVYTVTGSQRPTKNLTVHLYGKESGFGRDLKIDSGELILTRIEKSQKKLYYTYSYYAKGIRTVAGDSGAPIYTTPNKDEGVKIVGILWGITTINGVGMTIFSSWNDIEKELRLKPISP